MSLFITLLKLPVLGTRERVTHTRTLCGLVAPSDWFCLMHDKQKWHVSLPGRNMALLAQYSPEHFPSAEKPSDVTGDSGCSISQDPEGRSCREWRPSQAAQAMS